MNYHTPPAKYLVTLLLAVILINFPSYAQDRCAARADFDWNDHTGTPTGNTYSDESVDFTFSVSGSGGITYNTTYSGTALPTGVNEYNTVWAMQQNDNNINTWVIDFNGDLLYDFCFQLLDMDNGEGSVDFATVNAYDPSNTLITLTAGDLSDQGDRIQYNGSNQFQGIGASPTNSGTTPRSNVTICFPVPVQRVEIIYNSYDGTTAQYIGVGDFNYCTLDFDNDGIKNDADTDSDGDGIADATEGNSAGDADGDGIPNFGDTDFTTWLDANGDNVNDNLDTDLDQTPDALDLDSDNDGIPDTTEYIPYGGGSGPADTDNDGTDDYQDSDADDDGISDLIEGNDIDFDGVADIALAGTDADGDGIDDAFDSVDGRESAGNASGSFALVLDNILDEDDIPDYRDTDDDGDGVLTEDELTDTNGDGRPEYGQACEDGSILDWESFALGAVPTGTVYSLDGVNISIEFTDASGDVTAYEIDNDTHGEQAVGLTQDVDNANIITRVAIKYDRPVEGLCFDLLDVDKSAPQFVDSLALNIYADGDVIALTAANIRTGSYNSLQDNNFITGDANVDDDQYFGNVRVCPTKTIDSLVIFYGNALAPGTQRVGINDLTWCGIDSDFDEILDIDDTDDNNNGIPDIVEAGGIDPSLDTDGDKVPDYQDSDFPGFADTNADGINDNFDLDMDGVPDHIDKDTDNDGIPDAVEANGGLLPTNMDKDGAWGPAYALANDADGDGIVDDVDTSEGGTALTVPDTDGDGIADFRDLDADGDGVPDVLEAGGADDDGDGMIDGFSDKSNDGLDDNLDPDLFGVTLLKGDLVLRARRSDTDGYPDYIDIDSDADGITDNVEAQSSAAFTAPSGTDTDGDGWDDAYDPDNGGTTLAPLDTDGDGVADFRDSNSDDDGVPDRIEGHDADGDGVADRSSSGTDTDGDGLDDAYDPDNGGTGAGLQDTDGDGRLDYRDTDDDDDGIVTSSEDTNGNGNFADDFTQGGSPVPDYLYFTSDPDGDGVINILDMDDNNDGVPDSQQATCTPLSGNGMTATETGGVTNPTSAEGVPDGAFAVVGTGEVLTLELDGTVPLGITLTLRMARHTGGGPTGTLRVEQSGDNVTYTNAQDFDFTSNTLADYGYQLTADAQFIRFTQISQTNRVESISYTYDDCLDQDTDGDGLPDRLDLDADADGIPNAVEANGGSLPANMNENGQYPATYALANDTDGDGYVNDLDSDDGGTALANTDTDGDTIPDALDADSDGDGLPDRIESPGTDTNADGYADTFTDTDGDGVQDYRDSDSDDDGLPDLAEAQTTAAYTAPSGTDTDGDGIDDAFDADNGGTDLVGNDHDGDGTPDFQDADSDGDSISDLIEANDNDADGVADASLTGLDTDGDGLDNAFDPDNGGTAVAQQNTDADAEPDWRDSDDDGDGRGTQDETTDVNPANGTPDYLESNGNTCGSGKLSNGTGYAASVLESNGGTRSTAGIGAADYVGASDNYTTLAYVDAAGEYITYYLGEVVEEGTVLTLVISAFEASSAATFSASLDDNTYSGAVTYSNIAVRTSTETQLFVVPAGGARYIRFAWVSGTPYFDGLSFASCASDLDNDGIIDSSDNDSDNDGLSDTQEGNGTDPGADADGDGVPNFEDPDFSGFEDINGDGINDNFDFDLDGLANHQDLDSDNDGIPDAVEANGGTLPANMTAEGAYPYSYIFGNDTDGDGYANDVDATNGGTALTNPDSDSDGLADFTDKDSDNDGITDAIEAGGVDANRDGIHDSFVDTDGDGLNDAVDTDNGGVALNIMDTDGDSSPDYLDTDSDNDGAGSPGLGDIFEGHDTNFDGTPAWDDNGNLTLDAGEGNIDLDGDGILDAFDPDMGGIGATLEDTDNDGTADFQDTDDDDDGILTISEDDNGDGNYFNDFSQGQAGQYAAIPDYLYNHAAPLPVELISFKATLVDEETSVLLEWITASEKNNDYFEVLFSSDGVDFEKIGLVSGSGTTKMKTTYQYVHKGIASGFSYYRLRQVDMDGASDLSEIKKVNKKTFGAANVEVFPNPATDFVKVRLSVPATRIILYNTQGQLLQTWQMEAGTRFLVLDIANLPTGHYILHISGEQFVFKKRIVIN